MHADLQLQAAIESLGISTGTHPAYAKWLPDEVRD